jgi:ACS family glucarate transporter-like MFS transporter
VARKTTCTFSQAGTIGYPVILVSQPVGENMIKPSREFCIPMHERFRSKASQRRAQGIVLLMVAFSVMSYFDRIIMSIAGPVIMTESHLSETQMGAIYSAFTFGYAICMIPGGRLADRFGPRRVLTVMGFGAAFFTGLTAAGGKQLSGTWLGVVLSFLAIRLALGCFTAPLYPSCAILNARWTPLTSRARVWGWVASGSGIGGALSPLLFASMMDRFGRPISFVASAVVTGALAAIWYWYVRDFPGSTGGATSSPSTRKGSWHATFRNRHLILLTLSYLTANYFEYIFFYWLFYYLGRIRHASASESALSSSIIWAAWAIMTPVGGWVSDRLVSRYGRKIGRRLLPVFCLTVAAGLLIIAVNLTGLVSMVVMLFVTLALAAATDGPYWVSSSDIGEEHVGVAGGILNTGGNVGGFLAPIVTPIIASRLGWSAALYAGSAIVLAGALLWFLIDVPGPPVRDSREVVCQS